jgi:uncharacterized protein (DUF3820 family)
MSVQVPKAKKQEECAGCGSTRLRLVKCDPPHFARRDCMDCGRCGSPIKAPWSLERARAFVMPFGRHKGRTVGELADTTDGWDYLRWASKNLQGNVGIAASITVGKHTAEVAS